MTTSIQQPRGLAETSLRLHDVFSVTNHISNGMAQVAKLYNLEEQCVNDLKALIEAACLQHTESKRLTAKVSNMPLAQETYCLVRSEYPVPWEEGDVPPSYQGREGVYRAERFSALVAEWSGKGRQKCYQI